MSSVKLPYFATAASFLIGARRLLARLELLHVPPADVHVASVLVHAGGEVPNVHLASACALLLHLLSIISLSRHLLLLLWFG